MVQNNTVNIKDMSPLDLAKYIKIENKGWLSSEGRQRRIHKLALLGELGNYYSLDDYITLFNYSGSADELVLPDIFLHLSGLQNSKSRLYRIHKLVLNKHMKCIEHGALKGCELREIELNEGLLCIHNEGMSFNKLDSLVIPSTIQVLGDGCLGSTFNDGASLYINSDHIGIFYLLRALDSLSGRLEVIFKKNRKKEILKDRSALTRDNDRMLAQLNTVTLQARTLKNITLKFE